jgi:acyl-CoA synthetase (AMP-forming)/AMP-acid ligase II
LLFSSGSTDKPKGVLSAHRGVSIQCWRLARIQGFDDDVRSWTPNGFFWSGNFCLVLGATLAVGGALVLQRTFQPEEALELMAAERVTYLFAWRHQWVQLVEAPNWASVDLSALKYMDAESVIAQHPTVKTTWTEARHAFGNTETFTFITAYPACTSREIGGASHGLPLGGTTIKIVDPFTGATMKLGERGEIAVKGPTLMLGYVGIPLDETLDDQGFLRTGDGGYIDDAGRLFWEGRLTDIIKTGGANVSPVEIDTVIRECPGVKANQTVGVPHETLGELVVACVVPHDGFALDETTIRNFAREKLASYKVPRRVLVFSEDELAMTGTNKIKTNDLRKLVSERLQGETTF